MIIIGVDPGLHGAIAVYDSASGAVLEVFDTPTLTTIVGGKERERVDKAQLLHEAIRLRVQYGAAFVVIEELVAPSPINRKTGQKRQNGPAGLLAQGRVYGDTEMAFFGSRYRVEYVHPASWKKALRVPAVKTAAVARADELFPGNRSLWRGARGGALDGRAEAAMIAKYGADTWAMTR